MKYGILYFLLAFIIIGISDAQNNEVIYLKNGSMVRGKILEMQPDKYVKFGSKDGSVWVFNFSEIEKFDLYDKSSFKPTQDSIRRNFIRADIGFLVGTVENDMKAPLSFLTTYNINIYKCLYIGMGTGLEFFQMTYVPFVADFRIQPYANGLSIYFQAGYTMPLSKTSTLSDGEYKFKPGFLINPGISYTFRTESEAAFTIGIGYRYQKTNSERVYSPIYYSSYYQNYELINKMNRFSIRLGYTFK